jgi:nucleotide-binding universal stress UspA family protein
MSAFDHILVPVDGSEGSLRAARFAASLGAPSWRRRTQA